MKIISLLEEMSWNHNNEHADAEAIYVSDTGNVLRWTLLPGQSITPSITPSSPVYVTVLKGTGYFYKADGSEVVAGEQSLIVFEPGEIHGVRTESEPLVCIAIMHPHPNSK